MKKIKDIQDLVGDTPLIKLKGPSEETGCEIFGKAEFFNPGQSIKDRAALYIIKDAERKGLLKKGGTIVEGTAGNTGIGLSIICLLYTSPSPRDMRRSRMPSSA